MYTRNRNRYAGHCDHCDAAVDAGKGFLVRYAAHWHVRCVRCYSDTGLKRADLLGNARQRIFSRQFN